MPAFAHLVVGLGNPEPDYAGTRHNVGFMAIDAIAQSFGISQWKKKFRGFIGGAENFLLLKPQTFMNLSGDAVSEAMQFFQLGPSNVIVFHDDLDLLPGQIRIKQGGGTGGHNGLKSIDAHIGPGYWRVRIGIGHPGVKGDAVTNYVLGPFSKTDKIWLEPLLTTLADDFDLMLEGKEVDYLKRIELKTAADKE